MSNQQERSAPPARGQADPRAISRMVIGRFCVTTAFLTLWMVRQPEHFTDGTCAGGMAGAAVVTAFLAALCGERFRGPAPNRWDEMLGYFALAALAQAFSAV
ncbi:MAG TPA: hypothetical protein VGO34_07320 [Alphaproteobacteria bacterium]|jgi:hypothetical protein